MRMNWILFSVTALAFTVANAQNHPMTSTSLPSHTDYGTPQPIDENAAELQVNHDREFVKEIAAANAAAATLQTLAEKNSQNEQIKQLAKKMADDHLRLANQVQPVAQQLGFATKNDPERKDKKRFARLGGLSGAQFDDEFINSTMKDLEQTRKDFNQEAAKSQNVALRDAARDGAAALSQHLEMLGTIMKNHSDHSAKDSKPEKAS